MLDQLIIGSTSSLDFDASVAERVIGQPTKKEIKATIPFSNITYDFSAINGELYWNERELTYVLEILADTPEELETKKILFGAWVMNVLDEEIHDPFIADYHFKGTFSDLSFADEEDIEKTTATVKFMAYPYKIANEQKSYKKTIAPDTSETITVANNSSHRLSPTITVDGVCTISFDGESYTVPTGTYTGVAVWLAVGDNAVTVSNPSVDTACDFEISFFEEVF